MSVEINLDGHGVEVICVRELDSELLVQPFLTRPVGFPDGRGEVAEFRQERPPRARAA